VANVWFEHFDQPPRLQILRHIPDRLPSDVGTLHCHHSRSFTVIAQGGGV